jgi:hypothetical protein
VVEVPPSVVAVPTREVVVVSIIRTVVVVTGAPWVVVTGAPWVVVTGSVVGPDVTLWVVVGAVEVTLATTSNSLPPPGATRDASAPFTYRSTSHA